MFHFVSNYSFKKRIHSTFRNISLVTLVFLFEIIKSVILKFEKCFESFKNMIQILKFIRKNLLYRFNLQVMSRLVLQRFIEKYNF